eukprot:6423294-Pyramimonas_sp.AAC.1
MVLRTPKELESCVSPGPIGFPIGVLLELMPREDIRAIGTISGPVRGKQTINRGELIAAISALRLQGLITDSIYVIRGYRHGALWRHRYKTVSLDCALEQYF